MGIFTRKVALDALVDKLMVIYQRFAYFSVNFIDFSMAAIFNSNIPVISQSLNAFPTIIIESVDHQNNGIYTRSLALDVLVAKLMVNHQRFDYFSVNISIFHGGHLGFQHGRHYIQSILSSSNQ